MDAEFYDRDVFSAASGKTESRLYVKIPFQADLQKESFDVADRLATDSDKRVYSGAWKTYLAAKAPKKKAPARKKK